MTSRAPASSLPSSPAAGKLPAPPPPGAPSSKLSLPPGASAKLPAGAPSSKLPPAPPAARTGRVREILSPLLQPALELSQAGRGSVQVPGAKPTAPASVMLPVQAPPTPPAALVSALSDGKDNDEELAPQTPPAALGGLGSAGVPLLPVPVPSQLLSEQEVTRLLGPSSASTWGGLSAAAAALVAEEGGEHVGLGRRSPSREGLERSLAFKRWARGRCFRCLERGHQVRACREPFRCIRCRRPGHRERFCRARSPVARSRSPDTCSPGQQSCSLSVQPCCPSVTRSWAEVMSHSTLRVSVPPLSPSGCCKDPDASTSLDSALQSQFALLRMELLQLVADRIEEVSRPLREEVAAFKLLLAHVTDSLERADSFASCESTEQESCVLVDDDAVVEMTLKVGEEAIVGKAPEESTEVGEECIFGCFSPRARSCPSPQLDVMVASECVDISRIMAPVMQIMPELQQLCVEPSPPLSMVHLQVDSLGTSVVASALAPVEPSHLGEVVEADVLAPNSEALFAKELCELLVSLEAASPGYGKEIACVLAGQASEVVIRRVEKSLRRVRKKSGVARKVSATA